MESGSEHEVELVPSPDPNKTLTGTGHICPEHAPGVLIPRPRSLLHDCGACADRPTKTELSGSLLGTLSGNSEQVRNFSQPEPGGTLRHCQAPPAGTPPKAKAAPHAVATRTRTFLNRCNCLKPLRRHITKPSEPVRTFHKLR